MAIPVGVEIGGFRAEDASATLTATARAFWPDPLFGHFSRSALQEHRLIPNFMGPLIEDAAHHGEVLVARFHGRPIGSASWLPPGSLPRPAGREARIMAGAVAAVAKGRHRLLALRLLHATERRHPTEPHWYLALLGVDPRWQRRGVSHELLHPVLERCDRQGLPAYLETQKEENLAFYARYGFTVCDEVALHGAPRVWTMWREPRPDS